MLFVKVTQMHSYRRVYLFNAILLTEIFCYRYLTFNYSAKNNIVSMKFSGRFRHLLDIKCAIFFSFA